MPMWDFLKDKRRRDMIGWVASGAAAVLAGGWALYIHLYPDVPRPNGPTGDCNFANNAPVNAGNGNITLDCANMKAGIKG
jgi:hypothetical protein